MKSLIPKNATIKDCLFFIGDGGKYVYYTWKEVVMNLLIDVLIAIIFGGLLILYILFKEGLIQEVLVK